MLRSRAVRIACLLLLALALPSWGAPLVGMESEIDPRLVALIEQLGDPSPARRKAAEIALLHVQTASPQVVRALEWGGRHPDGRVRRSAPDVLERLFARIRDKSPRLRGEGREAFDRGDYSAMARAYRPLSLVDLEDAIWLGHAHQLTGAWPACADAYGRALDLIDSWLKDNEQETDTDRGRRRTNLLRRRPALILLAGRIQDRLLDDPAGAAATFRRVLRFTPGSDRTVQELAADWRQRVTDALEAGGVPASKTDSKLRSLLRFPALVLPELARVEERLGQVDAALETWWRIHLLGRLYDANAGGFDTEAVGRLVALEGGGETDIPAMILLGPKAPTFRFDPSDPKVLARAYDVDRQFWTFALSPPPGQEFATLTAECDIEQFKAGYGGQFNCWALAGTGKVRQIGLGTVRWPDKLPGRKVVTQKIRIPAGTGVVHFRTGAWDDKFKVHGLTLTAGFRPRRDDELRPAPGVWIQNECLPKGGTLTQNGAPWSNKTARSGMAPGRYAIAYEHADRARAARFDLALRPGSQVGLFINLDSPFNQGLTSLGGVKTSYGPEASLARLPDGRWLLAWPDGLSIRFSVSRDLVKWDPHGKLSGHGMFGSHFTCRDPSLFVDGAGTIWLAYFSNRLDLEQFSTGGYRMFLSHSRDGKNFSPPRVLGWKSLGGWPPGSIHMLSGPDGKVWLFWRGFHGRAATPGEVGQLEPLPLAFTAAKRERIWNPRATFDASGRLHLVWNDFSEGLFYARRDADETWSQPVALPTKKSSGSASHPVLVVRGERLALIYSTLNNAWLQRGVFEDGRPILDEAVKIANHVVPRCSQGLLLTDDGRAVMLCGKDTVWVLHAPVGELVRGDGE